MPVHMDRIADTGRSAKPNPAIVGSTLKATGLLPRSLPVTRTAAAKPKRGAESAPIAAEAAKSAAKPVGTLSPSFARMAACMRFRSYIGS